MACRGLNNGREGTGTNAQISLGVWGRNLAMRRGLASETRQRSCQCCRDSALWVPEHGSGGRGTRSVGFTPSCGEIPTHALRWEEAKAFFFPKDSTWQVKKIHIREQSQRAFCPPSAR